MTALHLESRRAESAARSARAAAVSRQPNDSGTAGGQTASDGRHYPLARNAAEHARLALQAEFWAADAAALFASADLPRGGRVADLGCGTLHIAEQLGRAVGEHGTVLALDSDALLLASLRAHALAPVAVEHGDAYALAWPDACLDAAHARFLACPAGRVDTLVAEMRRVVRPGGTLLLQEPVGDSWDVPAGDAWPRTLALIRAGFRARGGDFDLGARLVDRLAAAGLRDVRTRTITHTFAASHPYARLPLAFCDSLAPLWRERAMVDDGELAGLRSAIERGLAAPRAKVTTFTLVQAWGRR